MTDDPQTKTPETGSPFYRDLADPTLSAAALAQKYKMPAKTIINYRRPFRIAEHRAEKT